MSEFDSQLAEIKRGAREVLVESELLRKLKKAQPLRIKVGFDPTAPDLHLGHTVLLNKMRQFQQLGHQVVFLIGDFTGLIGDPSGRNATRPALTREEVESNALTYKEQVFKILDPERTVVDFNSRWFGAMPASRLIEIAGKYSVARMLEREDFSQRHKKGESIALHEFFYPLVQGYDSVALHADVELGGTDQKFNLLVGRHLQEAFGQEPQIVLTMPLLEGLDGTNKMSKSLDNYVAIADPPDAIFGKLMSISDELMWRYFELLSFRPLQEIAALKRRVAEGGNPRDVKIELAKEIVARFHGTALSELALSEFIARFRDKALPTDLTPQALTVDPRGLRLANVLKEGGLASSTSEANRKIDEGAVRIDGERVTDRGRVLLPGADHVFQVGSRRFARLKLVQKLG